MAIYQIKYTSGVDTITIQPGSVNGAAGVADTDLELYGQGTLNWGKGVDQNQLRIMECWACPQAISGPLRPVNKDDTGVTGYSGDGVSTGINNPTPGQLWYNTTDEKLYICRNTNQLPALWETAGADPDLFLPLTGGLLTGTLDQQGTQPRYGLLDAGGIKGKFELVQDPTVVDPTVIPAYPADPAYPDTPNQLVYPPITDHLVIGKENVNTSQWIAQLRIQDDGIVIRKNAGGKQGNGTIRVETTVNALHTENTLTTKKWVDDEKTELEGRVVRKDVTSTQTMIGSLDIVEGSPRLRLRSTGNTTDANIEFYDQTTDLKGVLYLDQQGGGIDHLTLAKRIGGITRTRLTLEDDKIYITGETPGDGTTTIWTDGVAQGKIQTPHTVTGDSAFTLTTKKYVDDEITAVNTAIGTAGYMVTTGDTATGTYKFGPPNDDITLDNAEFKSVLGGSNFHTLIDGPTINVQNGSSTDKTTILGEKINLVKGSNTAQVDASGATWDTTGDPTTYVQLTDVSVYSQNNAGDNWGRLQGSTLTLRSDNQFPNTTQTLLANAEDGFLTNYVVDSVTDFQRTGYLKHSVNVGGSLTAELLVNQNIVGTGSSYATVQGTGRFNAYSALGTANPTTNYIHAPDIRFAAPDESDLQEMGMKFYRGAPEHEFMKGSVSLKSNTPLLGGNAQNRDQLHIATFTKSGGIPHENQSLVMDDLGLALRGAPTLAGGDHGGKLLIQAHELDGDDFGIYFQRGNPSGTARTTEYTSNASIELQSFYNTFLGKYRTTGLFIEYRDDDTASSSYNGRLELNELGVEMHGPDEISKLRVSSTFIEIKDASIFLTGDTAHTTGQLGGWAVPRIYRGTSRPVSGNVNPGDFWMDESINGHLYVAITTTGGVGVWVTTIGGLPNQNVEGSGATYVS